MNSNVKSSTSTGQSTFKFQVVVILELCGQQSESTLKPHPLNANLIQLNRAQSRHGKRTIIYLSVQLELSINICSNLRLEPCEGRCVKCCISQDRVHSVWNLSLKIIVLSIYIIRFCFLYTGST